MSNEEMIVSTPEADPIMERSEGVILMRKHNEAVDYLRRQDCAMLTTLRDHLGENIRLHNILNGIKAEINRLKKILQTPKPKLKLTLLLVGLLIAIGGSALSTKVLRSSSLLPIFLVVGIALVAVAIALKVIGNKKWQALMDETNEKLRVEEQKAEEAQKDIDEYWENHALPFISSIIPDRFPVAHVLDYNTVCGMLYVMDNLRADTVKEAINLYDELCFRANMKASFQSMESSLYETARNSARYAAAAERSAAANERAAASAALTAASAASIASSASSMASSVSRASNASVEASRAVRDAADRI